MFVLEEKLKQGERTSTVKGLLDGEVLVRKTYSPKHKNLFELEVRNLAEVRRSGFRDFVDVTSIDHNGYALFFPFIEGEDCFQALSLGKNMVLGKVAETMHNELHSINSLDDPNFPFSPDSLRRVNDPLFYTKFVLENPQSGVDKEVIKAMKKLLQIPLSVTFGRYDPELSNFLLPLDGRVLAIDYEYVVRQDALYPFAYAAVHLMKDGYEDAGRKFLHVSEGAMNSFGDHMEDRLVLNIAETCSYLISEYNRQGKTEESEKVSRILREFL